MSVVEEDVVWQISRKLIVFDLLNSSLFFVLVSRLSRSPCGWASIIIFVFRDIVQIFTSVSTPLDVSFLKLSLKKTSKTTNYVGRKVRFSFVPTFSIEVASATCHKFLFLYNVQTSSSCGKIFQHSIFFSSNSIHFSDIVARQIFKFVSIFVVYFCCCSSSTF